MQPFRRKDDTDLILLTTLDERVTNIQKLIGTNLENQNNRLNTLEGYHITLPCETHNLRLKYIERIMLAVVIATISLMLRAVFVFLGAL